MLACLLAIFIFVLLNLRASPLHG